MAFIAQLICLVASVVAINAQSQTCCPDIGCIQHPPPYNILPTPKCPTSVTYMIYTRQNPAGEPLTLAAIPRSYNPNRRTIFFAHGLAESSKSEFVPRVRDALLQKEDANIIIIDWKELASSVIVPEVASNARLAGYLTAKHIQNFLRLPGNDPRKFWCIGFSTGAHFCGYVGMAMPANQKIGRVTGLSPAGPGLEDIPDITVGINPSAATFVDVVHSDNAHLLGSRRRQGHIDIYTYGYEFSVNLDIKSWFQMQLPVCEGKCQHNYAINTFISSLTASQDCFASSNHCLSEANHGSQCTTDFSCWAYAGYYADKSCSRTGIVSMKLDPKAPYCSV